MPGDISTSYDPEWGSSHKRDAIDDALFDLYGRICGVLGHSKPMDIRKLVVADLPTPLGATLSEWEWRLIRFAIERARDSL